MKMEDPLLTAYALGELRDEAAIAVIEARIASEPELAEEIEMIRALGTQISEAFDLECEGLSSESGSTANTVIPFEFGATKANEPLRRAKIARLSESAPVLKTNGRFSYGSLIGALVATVALAGIFSFNRFSESIDERKEEHRLVRVESLAEEASTEAMTLAEGIEQRIAEEKAMATAQFDAMTESISEDYELRLNPASLRDLSSIQGETEEGLRTQKDEISELRVTDEIKDLLVAQSEVKERSMKTADEPRLEGKLSTGPHVAMPSLARDYDQANAEALASASRQLEKQIGSVPGGKNSGEGFLPFYIQSGSFAEIEDSMGKGQLPDPSIIHIEELVNRFSFGTPFSEDKERFQIDFEVVQAPWNVRHDLMRITVHGSNQDWNKRPGTHLVFVVDNSASMAMSDRSPIVKAGLGHLVRRLDQRDYVTLIVAGSTTRSILSGIKGNEQERLLAAIDGIEPEKDSVMNVPEALKLAYASAIQGVETHYVVCVDGNLESEHWRESILAVEKGSKEGGRLNVFRFGRNRDSDGMLDRLAEMGKGALETIETLDGANRRFVDVASRAISVIAEDFEMELRLNRAFVRGYRLIGFDDERLPKRLGMASSSVGSGYSVTTLYELIPNHPLDAYQEPLPAHFVPVVESVESTDEAYVRLIVEYNEPGSLVRQKQDFAYTTGRVPDWKTASEDMRWSSAVAAFGLILREGKIGGVVDLELVEQLAQSALGEDKTGERQRFLELVQRVRQ